MLNIKISSLWRPGKFQLSQIGRKKLLHHTLALIFPKAKALDTTNGNYVGSCYLLQCPVNNDHFELKIVNFFKLSPIKAFLKPDILESAQ